MPLVPPTLHDRDPSDETAALVDLDVLAWRYEQLVEAGYPVDVAIALAERGDVDLHRACELLAQGCAPARALEILL